MATMSQNQRCEWWPSIPEPFFGILRFHCHCGRKFWTRQGYDGHYLLFHVVKGRV